MRSFEVKVNKKARRAALRAALAAHAQAGSFALIDGSGWKEPSTKQAAALVTAWGQQKPLVLVAAGDEDAIAKSFRNLEKVAVVEPSELEVAAVVWARSLLVSQAALAEVQARAGATGAAAKGEVAE
jgi:large subunit ribosomal protein L4